MLSKQETGPSHLKSIDSYHTTYSILRLLLFCSSVTAGSITTWAHDTQTNAVLAEAPPPLTDGIVFGDSNSETAHTLTTERSEVITGGLGQAAQRLLPLEKADWKGGHMTFTLRVDPEKQNYFTIRLWGEEANHNQLTLLCEGKQIGYRHLGDIEALDIGADTHCYPGRFIYRTCPLPLRMTKGKKQQTFTIQASGPIWGYGTSFEHYQKPMTEPSRGIYGAYTHIEGCFVPPPHEVQGRYPEHAPVRSEPGEEVLDALKKRVNGELLSLIKTPKQAANQMQTLFLAKAYLTPWTQAAGKLASVEKIVTSLDHLYRAYVKDPLIAQTERSTYNPDWFGIGPSGQVITLLYKELAPFLDLSIDDGTGKQVIRREGYTNMLLACREVHRENRRQYTNQSMINDLYGIYHANRGIAVLTPPKALPEEKALGYLYESIGLVPWLGKEKDGTPNYPLGKSFYQLTKKGLSKELGFVGSYGEVLDWCAQIYEATRPVPGQPGDEKIKQQIIKIAKARAPFRYPMQDSEGNRAMVQETIVGWRDTHYPGNVTYAQRPTMDGTPLEVAAATQDEQLLGFCQQMFADNQFFDSLKKAVGTSGLRTTAGLLAVPEQYEQIRKQLPTKHRLPMSWDQPDYVFSDEEDGVVAIKNGKEILYVSLYWRARYAVNFLARVHYLTPEIDRIATVSEAIECAPSGLEYTRPNWTNFGFANGGFRYPERIDSAHAGEKLPIARIPRDIAFKAGQESIFAGKGEFYTLRYGSYLIAMNMSEDKSFELTIPSEATSVKDLVSGNRNVVAGTTQNVGARTTAVFYLGH